ncbi:MAG: hypothetical protein H0V29_07700 [Thermoleophilaceae bacterium]|nr:hypothetical protein [Thermoleophilaceae bacterium]
MRYTLFLRTSVLLFGGAATVLGLVSIAGAQAKDDTTLIYFCLGWWALAAAAGLWLGRRDEVMRGVGRLLAGARGATSLPELDPGAIIFNRLWSLIVITIAAGGVAFLIPQVPAVACGYAIAVALAWRKQYRAVEAIEQRDGVQFHVEQTSPFKPTRLVRTAGLRRLEPTQAADSSS